MKSDFNQNRTPRHFMTSKDEMDSRAKKKSVMLKLGNIFLENEKAIYLHYM